jgi:hypothetical protein
MKLFKISFLALVAIATMSFTITSKSGFLKKPMVDISDCYRGISNLKYLVSCNPTTWSTAQANCTNEGSIESNYLHKDLSLSNFQPNTESCVGTDVICCVKFVETTTTPSCGAADAKLGEVDESTGEVGSGTKFIKVQQIECKSSSPQ